MAKRAARPHGAADLRGRFMESYNMNVNKRSILFLIIILLGFCALLPAQTPKKKNVKDLLPQYQKWLQEEVIYIISAKERDVFLQLDSDRERNIFIEAFWKQRNPDPASAENAYKIEHYKRIAYAKNQRDARFFDVYVMDVRTGVEHIVFQADSENSAAGWSWDDKALVVLSQVLFDADVETQLPARAGLLAKFLAGDKSDKAQKALDEWLKVTTGPLADALHRNKLELYGRAKAYDQAIAAAAAASADRDEADEQVRGIRASLIGLLTAEGGLAEGIEDDRGRLVLHKRSCPFLSMVDQQRSVCLIDLEMMSAVVGRPIRQTACRHDGDPCCTFVIVEN